MLRKQKEEQKKTCWSIFINTISQFSPMQMLVYYLLLSPMVVRAGFFDLPNPKNRQSLYGESDFSTSYYLHQVLKPYQTRQIEVSHGDRVVVVPDECKLILNKSAYIDNPLGVKMTYTCPEGGTANYTPLEKQISDNVYEGQKYESGTLFFKVPSTDGASHDTLNKITFIDCDMTMVETSQIKR